MIRTPEERDRIQSWILAALAEHGLCTAQGLGEALGLPSRSVGWFMGLLHARGLVVASSPSRHNQKWQLATAPVAVRPKRPTTAPVAVRPKRPTRPPGQNWPIKRNVGLDPEDEAWMAYWRQPRAVRRAAEARGDAV